MSEPVVAVITRTKNRPLLLKRAILSVMNQSFLDFIMVIVNDGGNLKEIENLVIKHKKTINGRVKIVNNPKSLGASAALNAGIKSSGSKYLAVLDDDDTWDPSFLKVTTNHLEKTGAKGVVTGSMIVREVVHDNKIEFISKESFIPTQAISYFLMAGVNQFPIHSFVYTREAANNIELYNESIYPIEDWEFNLRFMRLYDVDFISRPLAFYHIRNDKSGDMSNSAHDLHIEQTTKLLNEYLRKNIAGNSDNLGLVSNLSHYFGQILQILNEQRGYSHDIQGRLNQALAIGNYTKDKIEAIEERMIKLEKINQSLESKIKGRLKKTFRRG